MYVENITSSLGQPLDAPTFVSKLSRLAYVNFRVSAISVVADGGPQWSSGRNLSTADDVIQLFSVQVAIWQVPAF